MKNLILFFTLIFVSVFLKAQTISNIWATQHGKNIVIEYDLNGIENEYEIKAYCSIDGGLNWGNPLASVTGDVGPNIKIGTSKEIDWNVLNDREKLVGTDIIFKILAVPDENEQKTKFRQSFKISLNVSEQISGTDISVKVIEPAVIALLNGLSYNTDVSGNLKDYDFKISINASTEKGTVVNGITTAFANGYLEIFKMPANKKVFSQNYDRVSGGHLREERAGESALNNLKDLMITDLSIFFKK